MSHNYKQSKVRCSSTICKTMALQFGSNSNPYNSLHLPTSHRWAWNKMMIYSYSSSSSPPPTTSTSTRRRAALSSLFTVVTSSTFLYGGGVDRYSWSKPPPAISDFVELPNSGGVKVLDLRIGHHDDDGESTPSNGDKVVIHYYGRLAAKQGWRFDSTYDHKDQNGEPLPFEFVLGSGKVISGIESAVRSMKVGGIRRVVIPPSQGYQNTSQQPIPPNFFDRQRLFTTIFNPTRLANGEGSTLGTLIFDVELVSLRRRRR